MKHFRRALWLLLFILLTVTTQFGGIALVVSTSIVMFARPSIQRWSFRQVAGIFVFIFIYAFFLFAVVPLTAGFFGRVPMPLQVEHGVKPANKLTFILARNYVRKELRNTIYAVADEVRTKYPGTIINYLDTGFPFIGGFPLWPHLSHNDGKKADISFLYRHNKSNAYLTDVPSWIGYGVCEEPRPGEFDYGAVCEQKGFWQYSFIRDYVSQELKSTYVFDEERTAEMIMAFIRKKEIGKVLIEPHLKARLNLTHPKVRLHGCQAVRHDDHVHIQLR